MCNYVKHPEVEVVDVMCCEAGPHSLPSMKQDIIPTVMTMLVGHRNHKNRNSAHRRLAQLRTIYLQQCGQHPADTEIVHRRHVDKYGAKATAPCFGNTIDTSPDTHVLLQQCTTAKQRLLWCCAEARAQGAISTLNSTHRLPCRSFSAVYRANQRSTEAHLCV